MLVAPLHVLLVPRLSIPQILHGHALILPGRRHTRVDIVGQPGIIGGYLAVMDGEGDVDSVGGFVEVVEGLGLEGRGCR